MAVKRERVSMGASNLSARSNNPTPRIQSQNQLGSAREHSSSSNTARLETSSARERNGQRSGRLDMVHTIYLIL